MGRLFAPSGKAITSVRSDRSSDAALAAAQGFAADIVCIEAEAATNVIAPMRVTSKAPPAPKQGEPEPISGGKHLEIPQGAGYPPKVTTGEATWAFEVPTAGRYYLWCRVRWDDECGNSLTMHIDDAKPFTFGQDGTYKRWHWVRAPRRLSQLNLQEFSSSMELQMLPEPMQRALVGRAIRHFNEGRIAEDIFLRGHALGEHH